MRPKKVKTIVITAMLVILVYCVSVVYADLTATEGLAIDLSSAGAGTDFTIDFDPTELFGNRTWGDASTDTIVWTWNRATGTDPTITFNSGSIGLPALTLTTDLVVAEGGTGVSSLTDGGPLLGSGAGAITAMSVLGDGEIIIGDGTTDPVALDVGSSTAITILGTVATGTWQATAIADAYVPNNITVDLATLATTLTITDNESTAENNALIFTSGGDLDGGNLGLECDGTCYYTPSTGTITTTQFVGGGAGVTSVDAITGDSATAFFDAGTIEHEYGGLEADINAYTGLVAITGGSTAEVDSKSELEGHIADVADFAEADGDTYTGVHSFGGATTAIPWKVNATAAPTVEGQAIWESDTDELTVGDGSISIVVAAKTNTLFAFNIHDIDTGMDDIKMPFTRAVVITKVTAFVTGGTNVVGRLYEVDGDGDDADAVGVESSDWTFTTGETEDSSFNNATFDAGDYIQWDTTSVSGSVTGFMISVEGYEI